MCATDNGRPSPGGTGSLHTVVTDEDILYLNLAGTWLRLGGHGKGPLRNARCRLANRGIPRPEGTGGLEVTMMVFIGFMLAGERTPGK
jgi:hypothetical protein